MTAKHSGILAATAFLLAVVISALAYPRSHVTLSVLADAFQQRTLKVGSALPELAAYSLKRRRADIPPKGKSVLVMQACGCAVLDVEHVEEQASAAGIPTFRIWPEHSLGGAITPSNADDYFIPEDDWLGALGSPAPTFKAIWVEDGIIKRIDQK